MAVGRARCVSRFLLQRCNVYDVMIFFEFLGLTQWVDLAGDLRR